MQAICSNMIATTLLPSNPSTELCWNRKRWKANQANREESVKQKLSVSVYRCGSEGGRVLDSSFQDGSDDGFMHQQMLFAKGRGGVPVGLAEMGLWKVIYCQTAASFHTRACTDVSSSPVADTVRKSRVANKTGFVGRDVSCLILLQMQLWLGEGEMGTRVSKETRLPSLDKAVQFCCLDVGIEETLTLASFTVFCFVSTNATSQML